MSSYLLDLGNANTHCPLRRASYNPPAPVSYAARFDAHCPNMTVTERFATSRYYCLMPVHARGGLTLTFSRSTQDSIQYTQELLEHDVGVLFQNDNINTLDPDSEFRLVVMAGVAQDEVRKLSERLKFGFRQAIKNGHVLGNDRLWGYDKSGCVLTVNETEARAVRRIFDL